MAFHRSTHWWLHERRAPRSVHRSGGSSMMAEEDLVVLWKRNRKPPDISRGFLITTPVHCGMWDEQVGELPSWVVSIFLTIPNRSILLWSYTEKHVNQSQIHEDHRNVLRGSVETDGFRDLKSTWKSYWSQSTDTLMQKWLHHKL